MGLNSFCAALFATYLAVSGVRTANAAEAGLEGAWLQQTSECEEVFSRSRKGVAFKKPVNVFAPGFIITGNRLRTPQASCAIKRIKSVGGRQFLSLECSTPVAVDDVRAILARGPDGSLLRYLNDQDSTGSSYKRCFR